MNKENLREEENNVEEIIQKNAIKEQFGDNDYTSREIKNILQKKGITREEIKKFFLSRYTLEEVENIMNNLYSEGDNCQFSPLVFCF